MTLPAIFDNLRLPLIGSPLFIVSGPELVIAQCKLDEWLHQITEELAAWNRENPDKPAAPFAVNQIVHKSNDRLDQDMATCAKWKVPIVITSLGAIEDLNTAVKGWGGITLHDIINNRFAHKAIEKGATGLIPVAAGAGGHAGTLSPFALMQEIREWFDGPVALSGSIGNGASILAAQAMGADLGYKEGIVEGKAADIVYSDLFTGVKGNYLRQSIENAGLDPDNLPQGDYKTMNFGSGGNT
jgi:nitronate monooxygenase